MLAPHLQFGRDAEDAALEYFSAHFGGAKLIARNYRFGGGEIDLIFEQGTELVFVEVRARAINGMLQGFETINWRKRRRLERTIRRFLSRYTGPAKSLRLDVLSLEGGLNGGKWTHLKNAWI